MLRTLLTIRLVYYVRKNDSLETYLKTYKHRSTAAHRRLFRGAVGTIGVPDDLTPSSSPSPIAQSAPKLPPSVFAKPPTALDPQNLPSVCVFSATKRMAGTSQPLENGADDRAIIGLDDHVQQYYFFVSRICSFRLYRKRTAGARA